MNFLFTFAKSFQPNFSPFFRRFSKENCIFLCCALAHRAPVCKKLFEQFLKGFVEIDDFIRMSVTFAEEFFPNFDLPGLHGRRERGRCALRESPEGNI